MIKKALIMMFGSLAITVAGFFSFAALQLYKERNELLLVEIADYTLLVPLLLFMVFCLFNYLVFKDLGSFGQKALCILSSLVAVPVTYLVCKSILGKLLGYILLVFEDIFTKDSFFFVLILPSFIALGISFYVVKRIFGYFIPAKK